MCGRTAQANQSVALKGPLPPWFVWRISVQLEDLGAVRGAHTGMTRADQVFTNSTWTTFVRSTAKAAAQMPR